MSGSERYLTEAEAAELAQGAPGWVKDLLLCAPVEEALEACRCGEDGRLVASCGHSVCSEGHVYAYGCSHCQQAAEYEFWAAQGQQI